jgi:hypothetical protein
MNFETSNDFDFAFKDDLLDFAISENEEKISLIRKMCLIWLKSITMKNT